MCYIIVIIMLSPSPSRWRGGETCDSQTLPKGGGEAPTETFRTYLIHVDSSGRTCREAIAATNGLAPEVSRDFVRT